MDLPLYLEPRLEPRLASLLGATGFLRTLASGLGSPLNVVLPDQIVENLARFRAVYRKHRLSGEVFFAHKANRSSALVRRLAASRDGTGIDVASLGEVQHALGAGFAPAQIMATGPKNPEFLWLAARSGAAVNVDGRGELDDLAAVVRRYGLPRVRVLLRLSSFSSPGVRQLTRQSRFGTPVSELDALLKAVERHQDVVDFTGVGYHLDTTSIAEKAVALEGCVLVMNECRSRGLEPRVIDAGGGFGVNYLADGGQWDRYTTELTQAVMGNREALTWGRHGYGLRCEAGTLRGGLGLYPAHRPVAGERYLDALLSHPAPSLGRTLAASLLESLYDLYTEPGRALVDQCGLTLARVLEVRRTEAGDRMVRLEANADDIGLEEHGVLMDPVVVPRAGTRDPAADGEPVGVYLAGNLCLESDLITRRMVFLPCLPQPGDLLGFPNTAGYCMDFSADQAQHQPVARKVAAWQEEGAWRWCLDEQYWPVIQGEGIHEA
ncbi:Y4yA family PLP-dependent enzyme [Streptomyces sp. WM6378]|uniref:Y4yA family PLP-dependent enzyme n=1 Tax=Streptomyces sp. WM6378 TaxID=1415557 RepID=UPI0006AFF9D1|nr:Y4yA family PLP-dependent enzyme [Streptomyces sp. WM6378]KOU36345.1 diaminopimelate decarboxylase [Streptomyces sp. WM6378]